MDRMKIKDRLDLGHTAMFSLNLGFNFRQGKKHGFYNHWSSQRPPASVRVKVES